MSKILELLTPILTTSLSEVADRIGEKAEDKVRDFVSQIFIYQVITSVVATVFVFSCFSAIAVGWVMYYNVSVDGGLLSSLLLTAFGLGASSLGLLVFATKKLKPVPPKRAAEPNSLIVIADAAKALATALIDDRRSAAEASAQKQRVDDLEATTREIADSLALLVRIQEPKNREPSLQAPS